MARVVLDNKCVVQQPLVDDGEWMWSIHTLPGLCRRQKPEAGISVLLSKLFVVKPDGFCHKNDVCFVTVPTSLLRLCCKNHIC
jgi:hypothetical protein